MVCSPEPTVMNAKAAVVTNSTTRVSAFFECLTGFSMSGDSRIYCNKTDNVWEDAPSCTVTESNVYVNNYGAAASLGWWYYFLAVLLVLMLLLLAALVTWCWCCAPRSRVCNCHCCYFRRRNHRLHDSHRRRSDVFWMDTQSVSSKATSSGYPPKMGVRPPAKDPSKDSKVWMPHSHSVREINTSTK